MEIYWDDKGSPPVENDLHRILVQVVELAVQRAGKTDGCEVSVSFVEPEEMRQLNRDYRQQDIETDVLSFPGCVGGHQAKYAMGSAPFVVRGIPLALGDIVICTAVAKVQAEEYGHSFRREMAFLTAHGILHLLGHDHGDEESERAMIAEQEGILEALGITREN